jgi:ribosomal protein S17E
MSTFKVREVGVEEEKSVQEVEKELLENYFKEVLLKFQLNKQLLD